MIYKYKKLFAEILSNIHNNDKNDFASMIDLPPNNISGDLAFPCFSLSKALGVSPNVVAKNIVDNFYKIIDSNQKIVFDFSFVEKLEAIGPYVNLYIKDIFVFELLNDIFVKKEGYGRLDRNGLKYMIEGWALNTHKAAHVGHIRNIVISESLSRILDFAGYDVIKVCYWGDIGAHVAKWLWYFKNFHDGGIPKHDISRWSGMIYTRASKKIKENIEYKTQVDDLQKMLEDGDKDLLKLWEETRSLCIVELQKIMLELGTSNIDRYYTESEVEKPGIEIVKKMLSNGIAKQSQGAIIVDLEEYNLGIFVLLKNNGASLYSTKDIALANLKKNEFVCDKYISVVGEEQNYHFQQLFKTLELSGLDADNFYHLSHALVEGSKGKFASRDGGAPLYEDFRDEIVLEVKNMLINRYDKRLDSQNIDIDSMSKSIAFGVIKFSNLLPDVSKKIIFDLEKELSFEGETGPYLQYTYARCFSILKKALFINNELSFINFKQNFGIEEDEKRIILKLSEFPDIVYRSANKYKPNYVARYILDLSKTFNGYYHKYKIIQDDQNLQNSRLCIVWSVLQVLENGFKLLGIDKLEQM